MARGFKKGPRDPYADLPGEFKEAVMSSSPEQIESRIAEIRTNEAENQRNLREDLQVQEAKLEFDKLSAPYKMKAREFKLAARTALRQNRQPAFMEAVRGEAENTKELMLDSRVISAKSALKVAREQYSEATKANKLKERYCLYTLGMKGKA